MITTQQIKIIHTILPPRLKGKDAKGDLVAQFTKDEEKRSTKDLTQIQAEELIYFLKTGKLATSEVYGLFYTSNQQHRYILHLCRQIGWVKYNNSAAKFYADLERLGNWIKKHGYLHKPLRSYKKNELSKLVHQFEQMSTNILKQSR